jgi:hypothetical protein
MRRQSRRQPNAGEEDPDGHCAGAVAPGHRERGRSVPGDAFAGPHRVGNGRRPAEVQWTMSNTLAAIGIHVPTLRKQRHRHWREGGDLSRLSRIEGVHVTLCPDPDQRNGASTKLIWCAADAGCHDACWKDVLEGIRTGVIRLAFRRWRCPSARAGGTVRRDAAGRAAAADGGQDVPPQLGRFRPDSRTALRQTPAATESDV